MTSDAITLFDLPSKQSKAWSLNPWKIRCLLNYKGIPYKTEWVEYPDIAPKFKEFNIPPHPKGSNIADYTIPAICVPTGEYIMDSLAIAQYLESAYPKPSLHLDSPYLESVRTTLPKVTTSLAPIFTRPVCNDILNQSSHEYFKRTREVKFGMTLDELADGPQGGKAAWQAANPHLKEIAGMLRENDEGPFFMGKEVSYADFLLVTFMKMFDRIGELDPILAVDKEGFGGVWDACQKWLERDDH